MHVLIFAGGTLQPGSAVYRALATGQLIIAADSGASTALAWGKTPAYVVGDFDSLAPNIRAELEQAGCEMLPVNQEKDETDTELALQLAIDKGATRISLLGALGGDRFEHSIANILLLADFPTVLLELVDGKSRGWVLHGPGNTHIHGKKGDLLSLFPLTTDARDISTANLYYPLNYSTLKFGKPRGISNVLLEDEATVEIGSGIVLLVHTTV
jgi:thiamine pyrophosphokinase